MSGNPEPTVDPLLRSEERLALALESSQLGTWEWDIAADRLRLDERCARIFGIPDERFDGSFYRDFLRFVHEEDRERVRDAVDRAVRERAPARIEHRTVWPDGTVHWVNAMGRAWYDERTGAPLRMAGTVGNIDDRRAAEEDARGLEESLRRNLETLEIINSAGQALAAELDLTRLVQGATDAATRLSRASFGAFFYNVINDRGEAYTLYTLSGAPREAFAKFPMPRNTQVFNPTFQGEGVIRSGDITRDHRYGKNPPHHGMPAGHLPVRSYLAVPVISRSGEVIGGLFFGHPQTDVFGEREEKLVSGLAAQIAIAMDNARLFQRAQEAIAARDTFLSIASHELRTPLTSMKMYLQAARRRLDEARAADAPPDWLDKTVEQSERSVARLSRLVDDMLDVARIATGKLNMQAEHVDLSHLVRDVFERVASQLSFAGTEVELHLAEGVVGFWDRDRLDQVLMNLITNALKYAPGARVIASTSIRGDAGILEFSDRGPGIAVEHQSRIFERFERLDAGGKVSGLGLGLHIARHIVEAHGGRITVKSAVGEGTQFLIELPLAGLQKPGVAGAR